MPIKLIYRSNEAKKKEGLVNKINSMMKLPTNGLYILFDDLDFDDYPNPLYRNSKAFHMNLQNGIEEMSPPHILEIMNNPVCINLVWISKSINIASEEKFTWIYSHELRHLEQDFMYPQLTEISYFLKRTLDTLDSIITKYPIEIPAELDAELRAKQIVRELFGEKRCNLYIDKESQSENGKEYYKRLEQLELVWVPDSLEKKTLELICNNREHFTTQKQLLEKVNQKFTFDIDLLCSKL